MNGGPTPGIVEMRAGNAGGRRTRRRSPCPARKFTPEATPTPCGGPPLTLWGMTQPQRLSDPNTRHSPPPPDGWSVCGPRRPRGGAMVQRDAMRLNWRIAQSGQPREWRPASRLSQGAPPVGCPPSRRGLAGERGRLGGGTGSGRPDRFTGRHGTGLPDGIRVPDRLSVPVGAGGWAGAGEARCRAGLGHRGFRPGARGAAG